MNGSRTAGAGRDEGRSRDAAAWLRAAAAVATLVTGVVVAAVSWADSGPFTFVLSGGVAAWVAAVVVLGWSVLTGLGTGAYFAAPGVALLVAAVATRPGGASTPPAARHGPGDRRSP